MNILLINHYAGSPEYGMEYRPYYLAREWVRTGHHVRIVGATFSHLRIKNPAIREPLALELRDGIEYVWLNTPAYSGNGIGRIRNMLAFIRGLYRRQAQITEGFIPDAVIASSTYPLDNYPVRRIAKRHGAKFVYEVHDLWPLSPMELGGYSSRNPYIMVMQAAEDYAYRHCDKVVSLLPCAEPHMRVHGLPARKFAYVPNGIDVAEWTEAGEALPAAYRSAIAAAREGGHLLVCYAGSHGLANALDALLDAAKLMRASPVNFVLVGSGPEKARLERRIEAEGIVNALSLPAVRKGAIPALLAEMDILFIGLQRQSLFRFGISPNKLMDYMMAGKPVVQAIEAGNDLTAEAECGISVKPEDPAAIAEAVSRLAGMSKEERRVLGANGRRYVLAHHDYRVIAVEFLDAIRKE